MVYMIDGERSHKDFYGKKAKEGDYLYLGDEYHDDYDRYRVLWDSWYTGTRRFSKTRSFRQEPWERVSAALGYALYDREIDSNVLNVFRRADKAMYARKKEMKAVRQD